MKPYNLSKKIIPQPLRLLDNIGISLLFLMIPAIVLGRGLMEAIVGATVIVFILRSLVARDFSWAKEAWFILCIGIWFYLLTISFMVDHDPGDTLKRTLPWIRLPIFAVAISHAFLEKREIRKKLSLWTLLIINLVAIDTIVQFLTGTSLTGHDKYHHFRLNGPFDELIVGIFTTHLFFLALPPVLISASHLEGFFRRIGFVILCTGLPALCIILSGERSALMLMGICGLIMVLSIKALRKEFVHCLILGAFILFAAISLSSSLQGRFISQTGHQINNFKDSAYGRVFKNATTVWAHEPIFGVGPRQYRHACKEKGLPKLYSTKSHACGLHVHNIYMEWLVEAGLLGFSFFLGLIGLWLSRFRVTLKDIGDLNEDIELKLAWLAVLTYLWPITSSMSFFSNWNAIGFWLVLGWALSTCLPRRVYEDLRS